MNNKYEKALIKLESSNGEIVHTVTERLRV